MTQQVRVRFAPSPTGPLHIGGVRTALYNYLFSRRHNGRFVLRIEDTDQTRLVPGAEEYIIEALRWTGMEVDEGPNVDGPYGPYRQSQRKALYQGYARQLIDSGCAYYAFDTSEDLEAMRERMKKAGVPNPKYDAITREYMKNSLTLPADEVQERLDRGDPYVLRIKIPRQEEVKLYDLIRGYVRVQTNQLDDKVLYKSDGMPTYHMANVIDDHLMEITHVIRGEEWLPSAPLHVLLYEYLGWGESMPAFAHLPLILKPDGNGKLSKRDGDRLGIPVFPLDWRDPETGKVAMGYREQGYLPEAFLNILAMLGWHPQDNQEIFTLDELIEKFSLERVGKAGAKFDPDKARWYNQQFLRNRPPEQLAESFAEVVQARGYTPDYDYLVRVCRLLRDKATFVSQFWELGYYFFEPPAQFDAKVVRKKFDVQAETFLKHLLEAIEGLSGPSAEELAGVYQQTAESVGVSPGKYKQLLRVAITGEASGPDLFALMAILGRDELVRRLSDALERMPAQLAAE
jgi:glutamyl-tRNA synthetase